MKLVLKETIVDRITVALEGAAKDKRVVTAIQLTESESKEIYDLVYANHSSPFTFRSTYGQFRGDVLRGLVQFRGFKLALV